MLFNNPACAILDWRKQVKGQFSEVEVSGQRVYMSVSLKYTAKQLSTGLRQLTFLLIRNRVPASLHSLVNQLCWLFKLRITFPDRGSAGVSAARLEVAVEPWLSAGFWRPKQQRQKQWKVSVGLGQALGSCLSQHCGDTPCKHHGSRTVTI